MSTNLDRALSYVRNGFEVFPVHHPTDDGCSCRDPECGSPGKHPIPANGFKSSSKDEDRIRAWWAAHPDANIGVPVTRDRLVLDVDPRHGGTEALADLEAVHGKLSTREVATGGGGRHLWFRITPNGASFKKEIAPGLDVKTNGGYVLLPESKHASGGQYAWTCTDPASEAPAWLLELAAKPKHEPRPAVEPRACGIPEGTAYGLAALLEETEAVRAAPEGTRNHRLNQAAFACGQLEAGGELAAGEAKAALHDAAIAAGLSEIEVRKTIASGLGDGRKEPRVAPERPSPGGSPDTPDNRTNGQNPVNDAPLLVREPTGQSTGQTPELALEADILAHFESDLARRGVAGEERIAKVTYLALTSRLLPWGKVSNRPVSEIIKGTSASGKSYVATETIAFMPEGTVISLTSSSRLYLLYTEQTLEHRFI